MSIRAKQVALVVLALTAAFVGIWATFAPESFYTSFPLPGHHWVAASPPYNEHLVRDVGGLYLALLVISVWVAARPDPGAFVMAGVAWEAFSVPHLLFHARHLDALPAVDAVGNVVALGGTVLLAALLVLPPRRGAPVGERSLAE